MTEKNKKKIIDKIIGNQSSNVLFLTENTFPLFVNLQCHTQTYLLTQDFDALTRRGQVNYWCKLRPLENHEILSYDISSRVNRFAFLKKLILQLSKPSFFAVFIQKVCYRTGQWVNQTIKQLNNLRLLCQPFNANVLLFFHNLDVLLLSEIVIFMIDW